MNTDKPIVLIMCGGKSLRLWPLSQYRSKNFLSIFGFSPLELTIKRYLKITVKENIFLIANKKEEATLKKVPLIKKDNILLEPDSKNTAAAVFLSVLHIKERAPYDTPIIISPVDHLISKEKSFYAALSTALEVAQQGYICTLGITPKEPTPNFGYIQIGEAITNKVFSVKRFIEKPAVSVAARMIKKGDVFYNSGMFVATLSILDREFRKYYGPYDNFVKAFTKGKLSSLYETLPDSPFDKAVMEKTRYVRLIKSTFHWKDFGNWNAIHEVLSKDKKGNVCRGNVSVYEGKDNLLYLDDKNKKLLVAGVENLCFIDTKDYCLLTSRDFLDHLKKALKTFK